MRVFSPATPEVLEDFVAEAVSRLEPGDQPYRGPGRPRVVPSLCVWAALVVCVLRGFTSQLAVWRLLAHKGLWHYPRFAVSDQAVYDYLDQDLAEPMQDLFVQVSQLFTERLMPLTLAPFAQAVLALDQMHLDQVARLLPALRGAPSGDARRLPGTLTALFDLRRQQWQTVRHQPDPHQNEKAEARSVVEGLLPGTLLVADLGYFGFAWFDWLSSQGLFWLSRLRAKTSYTTVHVFYETATVFDGLVWLGSYRADQAGYLVRLVRYEVGNTTYQYVTNVLAPWVFPIGMIAQVYARRWDIELAFLLIKQHLGLHLLWSAKLRVIVQQVWAVLTISQILQALRMEIASQAQVDPFEVSMALLIQEAPEYARLGRNPIAVFVEQGHQARYLRPSSRTRLMVPDIPEDRLALPPPTLPLQRRARYGRRKGLGRGPLWGDTGQAPHPAAYWLAHPPPLLARLT